MPYTMGEYLVSIIITTNVRFADWNGIFGDEIMTTSWIG
jgi:hypothetical protein